jgi:hypothetical protein
VFTRLLNEHLNQSSLLHASHQQQRGQASAVMMVIV